MELDYGFRLLGPETEQQYIRIFKFLSCRPSLLSLVNCPFCKLRNYNSGKTMTQATSFLGPELGWFGGVLIPSCLLDF